ncbi:MAG: STAS domain-containing protein [Nocardioidaceae bacterium]|nr:STAS domain-containing protein [Nocardioidaceae bacterium]
MGVGSAAEDLFTLGSHLDGRNVAVVRNGLNDVLARATRDVVIDMGALESIDAAGLGMLTAAHLRAERSGQRLLLRNCSKEIRRVLAVTRLNRVLRLDRGNLELSA